MQFLLSALMNLETALIDKIQNSIGTLLDSGFILAGK
jgi:hypothetical protein